MRQDPEQRCRRTAIPSDSVNSCCTIRPRPAPSAARTASSCCRCAPRASSRIETFAQPIRSSEATAPNSRYSVGPSGFAYSSTMLRRLTGTVGKARRRRLRECSKRGCSSAFACAVVTPGRSFSVTP